MAGFVMVLVMPKGARDRLVRVFGIDLLAGSFFVDFAQAVGLVVRRQQGVAHRFRS